MTNEINISGVLLMMFVLLLPSHGVLKTFSFCILNITVITYSDAAFKVYQTDKYQVKSFTIYESFDLTIIAPVYTGLSCLDKECLVIQDIPEEPFAILKAGNAFPNDIRGR